MTDNHDDNTHGLVRAHVASRGELARLARERDEARAQLEDARDRLARLARIDAFMSSYRPGDVIEFDDLVTAACDEDGDQDHDPDWWTT